MERLGPETAMIFHVRRLDGTSVFVHPFTGKRRTLRLLESSRIEGRYGSEPSMGSFTGLRSALHRAIKSEVQKWALDGHVVHRLLASIAIGLGSWLYFSLIFSDLLSPGVDLLISLGLAATSLCLMISGDLHSMPTQQKKSELTAKIDAVYFQSDDFTCAVEAELSRIETRLALNGVEPVLEPPGTTAFGDDGDERRFFVDGLGSRFKPRDVGEIERLIAATTEEPVIGTEAVRRLLKTANCRKFDLALYLLFRELAGTHATAAPHGSR